MVYISSSGQIGGSSQQQPWGLAKIISIFWAILNFFYLLFGTLINPGGSDSSNRGGGGGGSGGGGGGRGPPPFGGRRGIHRIGRVSDIAAPPCAGGGCGR